MNRIRNKDIAEIVGVSRAAVTQVLNGSRPGCVSPEKRDAILRIAREHNYHPDFAAQVLGSGKTRTIGMPMPWMQSLSSSMSLGRLLNHVTRLLEKKGYIFSLLPVANDSPAKLNESMESLLCSRRVDGLIVNLPFLQNGLETSVSKNRVPTVTFAFSSDSGRPLPGISHVSFDCEKALNELIGRFTSYGPTALISLPLSSNHRIEIFSAHPELARFDLERDPYFLHNTAASVMVYIRKHFEQLKNYPCWLLQNDSFVYAADRVIREKGLLPGKDILLAGFDDMEENFEAPFFTTVRDPFDQMAAACVRLLFDRLAADDLPGEHLLIPSTVIYRGSSHPVNP